MRLLRRVLLARRVLPAFVVVVVLTVVGGLAGRIALPIRLSGSGLTHRAIGIELVTLVGVVLLAHVVQPRLWIWERLGAPRTRVVAAGVAVLVLAGVLPPLLAVLVQLPDYLPTAWLVANVLTLSGGTLVLCVLAGPLPGGALALVLYFANAVVDDLVDGARPHLPLTSYPGPAAHWWLAALLDLAAVALYTGTCGGSAWIRRRARNEG